MTTPILVTKLYVPRPRSNAVIRTHLIERLQEGLKHNHKLTLVAAPVGFGKTTLVSAWIANCDRKVAWLSLDHADSLPSRFLTYLISALQKIAPTIGTTALRMLESSQASAAVSEAILTVLLNEITTSPDNFIVVLDDYHTLESQAVDTILTFLLEQMPFQMHLVIISRETPQLPLARLRARGQLTELRPNDLRFSLSETAEFLKQVMGLAISAQDITRLEARTEGWVAGLQLAALSLQGHKDVADFITAFAGNHRYIVDYLMEEVLQQQSAQLRNFLLQTAILDRLCDSLCAAVVGQPGDSVRLEALEQGNFFVIPLDNKRQWYRYHHLFADVLYARLQEETATNPEQIAALHWRASIWYEHNNFLSEAIQHALAAQDFDRAANLLELVLPQMRESSREATMLDWFKALPVKLVRTRPLLSVGYAGALLASGELEKVEARLRDAEQWLKLNIADTPASQSNLGQIQATALAVRQAQENELRQLPSVIAMYRAGCAMAQGDVVNTITHAQRMLELVPANAYFLRGAALALLGLAFWANGNLEGAYQVLDEGKTNVHKADNANDLSGGEIALASIRFAQGRLQEALHIYEQALQQAKQAATAQRGVIEIYAGMSEIYRERHDIQAALQCLRRSQELGEQAGLAQNSYRWWLAMAGIKESQGDLDGALEALHAAERVFTVGFSPNTRPIAALRVRLWLAQGTQSKLEAAANWLHKQGLSTQDELSYLREFEHITLARLLLAQHKNTKPFGTKATESNDSPKLAKNPLSEVIQFLERLLQAAEAGGRRGSVIEILVLQALAHQLQGEPFQALIARALALAEPEGYARIFLGEGLGLLEDVAKRSSPQSYARKLLSTAGKLESTPSSQQTLVEPLSARELEVLRLFNTELSGPEIARKLNISLPTLRTHTNNIYNKLGANNRRTALRLAKERNLL